MLTCPVCQKKISRRDNLKRHLKNIHKLEGEELVKHLPLINGSPINPVVEGVKKFDEEQAMTELSERGFVVIKPQRITDVHKKIDMALFKGKSYKIGLASDCHLGSKYQQLTHLHAFYRLCADERIDTVLFMGDIVEGQKVYRGQEFELFIHGADAQTEYAVKNYPLIEGIKTLFIGGNHCESHWKTAGVDVCQRIGEERKDMEYLGMHGAFVHINGISCYLHHPSGGCAYARSYKQQKVIEQFAPEQKPHILLSGHLHIQNFMPSYRNVAAIMMPCFQAQTPYLKRKGLNPEVGGVILEFQVDETIEPHGVARVRPEFVMFKRIISNDF